MLHSVHDINPARLNAIIPALQRMEDDPAFLERRRHRFNEDELPPPYSSGSSTELPTPDPIPPPAEDDVDVDELLRKSLSDHEINSFRGRVNHYPPYHRYNDEVRQERARINREWGRRDENYIPLYRGPDLMGRPGQQRLHIMIRHSIKKRWEHLGVWHPEWGVPTGKFGGFKNHDGPKDWKWDRKSLYKERNYDRQPYQEQMASWPPRDEEFPDERAVRMYLERPGGWSETLEPPPSGSDVPADVHVDDREFLITSRPWYVWQLEVAEEEVKLKRDPKNSEIYDRARVIVTARWKAKGYWKGSWVDLPGWKWRHESPSPEPPDPNDMEFTTSEIDALEAIPPPTPPPPPKPSSLDGLPPFRFDHAWFLSRQNKTAAPPASAQSVSKPHEDGDGDHEGNRPGATAEPISGESAQRLLENDAYMAPRAAQEGLSCPATPRRRAEVCVDRDNYKQQRRPTTRRLLTRSDTRATCSRVRVEIPSPAARKTRRGQQASRAPTESSKISKPTPPPRRSSRIAERERQSKGTGVPSETVKAVDKEDLTPQPFEELNQQMKETLTRATIRKKDRIKERHPPTFSKPQGVAKRKGRFRSRRLNA